jgi:phenylalanine-4-hydroxylase
MKQLYQNYTDDDREVWRMLFERQIENLKDKSCPEYFENLEKLSGVLHADDIPNFVKLDEVLMHNNGWSIQVVPGIIPVDEFFELLAVKRFCSSTWLRMRSQLDYLQEPDMFHDIFGHIPLLMNHEYADFTQKVGNLGAKFKHIPEILNGLQSLYWFTIEFGILNRKGRRELYGAGIASSFGETNHIFSDEVAIEKFDLVKIINMSFVNSEIQNLYFEIESFNQLYETVDILADRWKHLV